MASSDFNIGPSGSGPIGPVAPPSSSRALMRVTPVAPQPANVGQESPLGRSGLSIRELLTAPDEIVVRSRTPAAALELGLEQARGSMIRNQPADALAALDEVWSGARHTETGWYLRGGSLALLGLPGEAARVVADGLKTHPQSSANAFLQALTSWSLGDLTAAQSALNNAGANRVPDALLLIQQAVLAAQNGDAARAEELLRRVAASWPDHPGLTYGRDMLREIARTRNRELRRASGAFKTPVSVDGLLHESAAEESVVESTAAFGKEISDDTARDSHRDVVLDALAALGRDIADGTKRQAQNSARALLTSLSAGGTFATSIPAPRAHATRAVLSAIIEALGNASATAEFGWEAESVDGQWQRATPGSTPHIVAGDAADRDSKNLLKSVRDLVEALQAGRVTDAQQQLRDARGTVGDSTLRILRAILGDRDRAEYRWTAADNAEQGAAYVRSGSPGPMLLVPLRLGLALLPDSEGLHAHLRVPADTDAAVSYAGSLGASFVGENADAMRGVAGRSGSLVAAVALLAIGMLAFAASLPVIAIVLGGAGTWLALRKGERAP